MKRIILLVVIAVIHASALSNEILLKEDHQDWSSFLVFINGKMVFRTATSYVSHVDTVLLTVDRYPEDCSAQYMAMNIAASKKATQSLKTDRFFGAMRIDEKPIHKITYQLEFVEGDEWFFATIMDFDGLETLVPEMRQGRHLRFKLEQDKKEFFLKFSLQGFSAAEKHIESLCKKINSGESDKDFFNKKAMPLSESGGKDEDYF